MIDQRGFEYERNSVRVLSKLNIATPDIAGARHDMPDITLKDRLGKKGGCELKITPTAAGSLVLKYYKGKGWAFGETENNEEKIFLQKLGEKNKVIQFLNSNWKNPALINDPVSGKKIFFGETKPTDGLRREAYARDLKKFGNKYINVSGNEIASYYNSKNTYYMNVGTHGFYLLNKDPLNINTKLTKQATVPEVPQFGPNVKSDIRLRVQYKGGGDYQFVMTMDFKGVTKSPYNVAPLPSKASVDVNVKMLKGGWSAAQKYFFVALIT